MKRMIHFVAVAAAVLSAAVAWSQPQDMAVFLDDMKVGRAQRERTVEGDRVVHVEKMLLELGRLGIPMVIETTVRTVETAKGVPLEFHYQSQMGPLGSSSKRGTIANGVIQLTVNEMGMKRTSTAPYPAGALMAEGLRLYRLNRGLRPGTRSTFIMFNPDDLTGIATDEVVGEAADVTLIGRTARLIAIKGTARTASGSIQGTEYVDAEGQVLRTSFNVLGKRFDIVACDKAFAMSPNKQVDLIDGGSVESPSPIPSPRKVREATFTLVPNDPSVPLLLPETGEQTVAVAAGGLVTVRAKVNASARGVRPYRGRDPIALAMLGSTAYVQSDDRRIVAQAKQIVGDTTDAAAAARKIETWVRAHITNKTLTVGYASAAATLSSRSGDCTEHAVLTAALCRAAGIPCRVVGGVAYTDQFGQWKRRFIGHAWNQAFIGGRWVCLDASLGADASRIALTVGTGDPLSFAGMIQSLGHFKITRVKVGPIR